MAGGQSEAAAARRVILAHVAPIAIGPLVIRPALRQITHADGRDEVVEPKVMEVLVALLRAGGAILTRDELCDAAWDGRIVGDDAINRVLARIRRLSEGIAADVFRLETIIKVGYRLLVTAATPPPADYPPAAAPTPAGSLTAVLAEPIARAGGPTARAADPAPPNPAPVAPMVATGSPAMPRPAIRSPGIDRRVMLGGGVAVAAAGAGGWSWFHGRSGAMADSVAVLPFANLSGDPAEAYFSDGIAEELRSALTRIVRLKVAARTSSELMRNADVPTAAAKLGVANVVTGSVRRSGNTIRVSAQLVDGTSGLVHWSDSYDRGTGDALAIQTGIATSVANSLNIALGHAERALLALGGTNNPAAHDAFLLGSALAAEQKNDAAMAAFTAAVAADPAYALAYAGLAAATAFFATGSSLPGRMTIALAEAETEARRAVALAPGLGLPLGVLGFVLMCRLDLRDADRALAGAYRRAPGDSLVLSYYARFEVHMGRGEIAVAAARRAFTLDPLRPNGLFMLGAILVHAGRFDEAIVTLRRGLLRLPDDVDARQSLTAALFATNRPAEARAIVATMPPDTWQYATGLAISATLLGDPAASDRALARLAQFPNATYQVAQVRAQRGERDAAFAALDRAVAVADSGLLMLKVDPLLAPLHGDPRFSALIRKIGFPSSRRDSALPAS